MSSCEGTLATGLSASRAVQGSLARLTPDLVNATTSCSATRQHAARQPDAADDVLAACMPAPHTPVHPPKAYAPIHVAVKGRL